MLCLADLERRRCDPPRAAGVLLMPIGRAKRRQKEPRILPFMPRNIVERPGSRSAGDEFVTWGPNYDWPPLVASNWEPVRHSEFNAKLLGICTLTVPHWKVSIANCKVVRWGPRGLRVFLPEEKWEDRFGNNHYRPIFCFDSDQAQRDFEEAALRAVRALISKEQLDWPSEPTVEEARKYNRDRFWYMRDWVATRKKNGHSIASWEATRRRILERDGYVCRDCGNTAVTLTCTHLIPCSQGGDDSDDNLITRCRRCSCLARKNAKRRARARLPSVDDDCPF
jgi:5-methylcytosine-specific restriction endonuclease McrA